MIISMMKKHSNLTIFALGIFIVFIVNLSISYKKYQELVYEEIYETKVEILNIYKKEDFYVLKLKNNDFTFFTNLENIDDITQKDNINIVFLTLKIDFFNYLKGFYTKIIYYEKLPSTLTISKTLINYSDSQHYNEMNKELFRALFFAVPISQELRDICANYGISHLMALSGFHLGILSFIIYWILYFPYNYFHTRYFPYRNIKYDLLLVVMVLLFLYVLLTDIVPSLFASLCIIELVNYYHNNCFISKISIFFVIMVFDIWSILYLFIYTVFQRYEKQSSTSSVF